MQMPTMSESATQVKSTQFLHRPSSFSVRPAMLLTMPSPGLGMSCMSTAMAAPMPVKKMPNASMRMSVGR